MTYLLNALQARAGEFISLRRDIHRHPELAFEEHRTAALVADKLEVWGYAVERGIGGTGVVGTLVRGQGTKRLGIRADMDALPIDEASGAEWASVHGGVMHACGHDGHTAMLLAAARHLAEQGAFDGTLHLIFQPAEEGGGGALRMMADGLFERFPCDAIFGLHNHPGAPAGSFLTRTGPMMAASDTVTICARGIITSATICSDTAIAPSIIDRVSGVIRPLAWAARSSSTATCCSRTARPGCSVPASSRCRAPARIS